MDIQALFDAISGIDRCLLICFIVFILIFGVITFRQIRSFVIRRKRRIKEPITIGLNPTTLPPSNEVSAEYEGEVSGATREETDETVSELSELRLDVAVPDKVFFNQVFDLAITIRQLGSPVLVEEDLSNVKSGEMQVEWPESQSFVQLRVRVSAPTCEIHGKDAYSFRLYRNNDSPIFYFQLVPKKQGKISIVIQMYHVDVWLGGARIHTMALEQLVGSVQLDITSEKINFPMYSTAQQVSYLTRRLEKLRETQAVKGIDTAPHILIEIEDIEAKLNEIQEQQGHIESSD